MESLRVTRERNALQAALKDLRRTQVQDLCRTHSISNTQRTKTALEAELVDHLVTEHAGRVIQLSKCDRSGCVLGNSTATRPLVPQKRPNPSSNDVPAHSKRQAAPAVQGPLQASTSTSDESATVKQLQASIDELQRKFTSLPAAPVQVLSESKVIELIDARLARQRQDFQQSLDELQEICKTGFLNMQASFDAVGEWRDEVNETFGKIQDWASAVESKIVEPLASTSSLSIEAKRLSHLSSTPSSLPPSSWQTPAAPAIPAHSTVRRHSRLSDATDFSLATIPETGTAEEEEEEEAPAYPANTSPTKAGQEEATGTSPARAAEKNVNIEQEATQIPFQGLEEHGATHASTDVRQQHQSSPSKPVGSHNIEHVPAAEVKHVTFTPVASRTLFGTERSTDERFDDLIDVENSCDATRSASKLPTWTACSPSWFPKPARPADSAFA